MEKKTVTFVIIIILLIVFVPLAVLSTVLHLQNKREGIDNPNHEFLYNGKLYFYDNNTLIGTYICENLDYCNYALSRNNFSYALLEHQEEKPIPFSLIQNRYAFLLDTSTAFLNEAKIILYDIKLNKKLGEYLEVKNYGIGIEKETYLVKNSDGKWGVLSFEDGVNMVIPFQYDYLGLIDVVTENKVTVENYVVMQAGKWFLIDNSNNKVSDVFTEEIVSYNKEYIITSNGSSMRLLTHDGRNRLFGEYKYLHFCGDYVAIVENSNTFYMFDIENNKELGNRHTVKEPNDLHFEITAKHIRVSLAEEIIENIAIP